MKTKQPKPGRTPIPIEEVLRGILKAPPAAPSAGAEPIKEKLRQIMRSTPDRAPKKT